jgi:hypothetical protein
MRLAFLLLGTVLIGSSAAAPSLAQREYHHGDGLYQGLRCESDETVVPVLGGVKCQKMPQCGPDETMTPGPDGLECRTAERADGAAARAGVRPLRPDDPTGDVPAVRATVVGLRFFEGPPRPKRRNYDDLFFYNAARYVYWELSLEHPAPGHAAPLTIEEVWRSPGGDVARRASHAFTVGADSTSSFFFSGARLVGTKTVETQSPLYSDCMRRQRESGQVSVNPCSPTTGVDIEQWPLGAYQVDIFIDQRKVATGWFAMRAKDQIYGEVRAKTLDRSSPAGVVAALGAKVTALRFFGSGSAATPQERRSYGDRFSVTARDISWELDLAHPATGQWVPLPIEALLYFQDAAGERIVQRKVFQSAVPADWRDTSHTDFFGWENDYYYYRSGAAANSPGRWLPGVYRVELYVLERKVAAGTFEVR